MSDDKISTWSAQKIIEGLRAGDADVRNYVYLQYVITSLKFPLNNRRMYAYSITVSDVFVAFWERLYAADSKNNKDVFASFQPRDNTENELQEWIYGLVDNTISDIVNRERKTVIREEPLLPDVPSKPMVDHLEEKEERAFLQECFTELWNTNSMQALTLLIRSQFSLDRKEYEKESARHKDFDDKKITYKELAGILHISVDNAKKLYERAQKKFQEIAKSKRKDIVV